MRDYIDGAPRGGIHATVHWCPANSTHRLHVVVGARRGPGWYVLMQRGCLGRVAGPFRDRSEAQRHADAVQQPAGVSK